MTTGITIDDLERQAEYAAQDLAELFLLIRRYREQQARADKAAT